MQNGVQEVCYYLLVVTEGVDQRVHQLYERGALWGADIVVLLEHVRQVRAHSLIDFLGELRHEQVQEAHEMVEV